ncbi:MAG: LysM domain-containing protein [Candidatus Adiutrix sp.]|jgi:nucleoid-associated protein YgaU|nr:LysM domain-containing protein [Candidatus Adiutrix sp.]
MRVNTRLGTAGLGAALALILLWGGSLKAQEGAAPDTGGPAGTITLTKVVPVYEFENLKVAVDQYRVASGDTLSKVLKARGLGGRETDQAQLLRLVRELNPELRDLNRLTVGQTLKLPAVNAGSAASAAAGPIQSPGSETVKIYERPQSSQEAARVVVLRHPVEALTPAEPGEAAPAATGTSSPSPAAPAPGSMVTASAPPKISLEAGGGPLDFPSGNAGPLAQDQVSQVVYRTVRIRPGDTLERLLRREGLPREAIYRHMLKITMDLNPEIKNPDLIRAGAELRIPAAGDYLAAAGLDPREVRAAALAINQRRPPAPVRMAAGAAENVRRLPDEGAETAKNTLGLIFTRLGDRVENQGGLTLAGAAEALELDTRIYPVIYTLSGAKVVLDLGSTLPQSTLAALRSQNFQVFRTRRGESLDRVLGSLWPLCGYYRVYTKEQAYEGGGDIRLKISADWMIWPTEEAWNSGQPLVLNKVGRAGRGTDPAWGRFLGDHGLKVLDLDRNLIQPAREAAADDPAPAAPAVTTLDSANPRFLASELVRLLGAEPRPVTPVEVKSGQNSQIVTAPLYWETAGNRVVLNFGELSSDEAAALRKNGLRVVSASLNSEAVIEAVLTGFGLKAQENMVLAAPAGGPGMTLTIKGRFVTMKPAKKYLLTYAALPGGLIRLLDPELKIIKY